MVIATPNLNLQKPENADDAGQYLNGTIAGGGLHSTLDTLDQAVLLTAAQTLTNKTIITPTIASFVNAQHGHANAAGGGAIGAGATLTNPVLVGPTISGLFTDYTVPAVRVTKSAVQNVVDSTDTVLSFDQESFDTGALHDNVTNNSRLTAVTAGKYQVTARINYASNAAGFRRSFIRANGSVTLQEDHRMAVNGFTTAASLTVLCDLAQTEYVELVVFQNSGGALDAGAELQMVRVGT